MYLVNLLSTDKFLHISGNSVVFLPFGLVYAWSSSWSGKISFHNPDNKTVSCVLVFVQPFSFQLIENDRNKNKSFVIYNPIQTKLRKKTFFELIPESL